MEERTALEGALLQLAAFHWHTGSVERARGLAERAQRQSQQPTAAATLLAWVILGSPAEDGAAGQQMDLREAEGLLGKALQQDPRNLEVGFQPGSDAKSTLWGPLLTTVPWRLCRLFWDRPSAYSAAATWPLPSRQSTTSWPVAPGSCQP